MINLKHLTICTTNECNFNCSYCFKKDVNKGTKPAKFTDWNNLLAFLAWSPNLNPIAHLNVMFTGGEPFLYPDNLVIGAKALKRYAHIKKCDIKIGCSTNLVDPEALIDLLYDSLMDIEGVSISWDGINEDNSENLETYFDLVNDFERDGIWDNVLIKIALTKKSVKTLSDSIRFLWDIGAKNVELYYVNGTDDYDDPERFGNILINQLTSLRSIELRMLRNYLYANSLGQYRFPYCTKMKELLYVDTYGNLFPCAFYSDETDVQGEFTDKYLLGNIRDRNIDENILNSVECNRSILSEDHFCHACTKECADKIKIIKKKEFGTLMHL